MSSKVVKKSKYSFKAYIIYLILILLSFYQNCPLGNWLGIYGEQPVLILSFLLLIYLLILNKLRFTKEEVILLFLGLYLFLVGLIGNLFYSASTGENTITGVNIFSKWIRNMIIYFSYVSFVICVIHYGRHVSRKRIFRPFFIALVILTILCIIEYLQIPNGLSFIPSVNTYPYWRIRLLTRESSFTSLMVLVVVSLGLLYSFKYKGSVYYIIVSMLCSFVLVYLSGSKTLLLIIPLFALLCLFPYFRKIKRSWIKGLIIVAAIALVFGLVPTFINMLNDDIQNFTSFATRGYSILSGLLIGIVFPFGVGGGIYIWAIQHYFEVFMEPLSFFTSRFNMGEIYSIIEATEDTTVAIKSGILQFNVYWGIIGTLVFVSLLYRVYRNLRTKKRFKQNRYLCNLFLVSILVVLFVRDMTTDFWIVFSMVSLLGSKEIKYAINPSLKTKVSVPQIEEMHKNIQTV